MIFGIGTDAVKLERVQRLWGSYGDRFARRILLDEEYALLRPGREPVRFLAMRFAAKEAIVKAMGTGFANGMWVRDAGTIPNALGQPQVIFSARGRRKCDELGIAGGHISLTDEDGLVIAVAILMKAG